MRATTQRVALLETLGKVKSAVPTKHTLPVCQSVLIQAANGQVRISGTDLEVALTASCKATVTKRGAVAIPPKALEVFLKAVKADSVTLSLGDKKSLKVDAGATTTIEGFEVQDFPSIPVVKAKAVEVAGFAKALSQVSYAMAKDGIKPALNGVFLAPDKGGMVLVAADGFRLAETKLKARGQLGEAIIPSRAVQLVEKLMPNKVSIRNGQTVKKGMPHISFEGEGLVLTASITQGHFPDYKKIIPTGGRAVTMDKKELKDALAIISATLPDNKAVRLETGRGNLTISAQDHDIGKTQAKVKAKGKAKIAFNIRYLKEILARADDKVILRTTDVLSPGVVKNNGTIHVLMPILVTD